MGHKVISISELMSGIVIVEDPALLCIEVEEEMPPPLPAWLAGAQKA